MLLDKGGSLLNFCKTGCPLYCHSVLARALRRRRFSQVFAVHRVFEPRNEHLIPTLLAPKDLFVWSRVVAVLDRVVVMSQRNEFTARRNFERFSQLVMKLPVEVELRHIK